MFKYIISLLLLFYSNQIISSGSDKAYNQLGYIIRDESGKYIFKVKQGDKYGVIDILGDEIIKPEYSSVEYLKNGLFYVYKDSLHGLLDLQGRVVLPLEYTQSLHIKYSKTHDYLMANDFYLIHKDGKYGVFDLKRKMIVILAEYDRIIDKDCAENIINTSKTEKQSDSVQHISALIIKDNQQSLIDLISGKVIIDFGLYDVVEPSDKYGYIVVKKEGKNAIIDYDNTIIIPFQDESLSIGQFGFLSHSATDSKTQFISANNLNKSKSYDRISMFSSGLSLVEQQGKVGVIDSLSREILIPDYDHIFITDNYIEAIMYGSVKSNSIKTSFFDTQGNVLFRDLAYDSAEYLTNSGLVVVRENNYEGLLNEKGKLIMPLKYRRIYVDEDTRIIRFEVNDEQGVKMGLADMRGKIVVKPKYDHIDPFIDGVAEVGLSSDNQYLHGLINTKGEEILKPQFSSMFFNMDSEKQYAKVYDNNKVGVISRSGNITIAPQYGDIVYQDKLDDEWGDLAITKLNNLYGLVNINTGKTIANPIYKYIFSMGKGDSVLFCIRNEEGNFVVDKNGNAIIPFTDKIVYPIDYSTNCHYLIQKEKDGQLGIISTDNVEVIPCMYDDIQLLRNDLFRVKLNDKFGIVDANQQIVFPIVYDFIMPYLYPASANLLLTKRGYDYGYIFLDEKSFVSSPVAKQIYESVSSR